MKLSNKAQYGVQAVFDMAFNADHKPAQIKEIAERQHIPARFLEQIFQDLRRAGLVSSRRGPKGGYTLAKQTSDIHLGDIIRAVEGPIHIGSTADEDKKARDSLRCRDVTYQIFEELSQNIEACFDALTVQDLCNKGRDMGLVKDTPHAHMYYI